VHINESEGHVLRATSRRVEIFVQAANNPPALDARAHAELFALVYRDCVGTVFRALRRLGIAEAELEDVVQEVFVVVHAKLPQYDASRCTTKTWVYGITRRVAANRRRRAMRIAKTEAQAPPPAPAVSPERLAGQSQASRLVARFLERLPEAQRSVFELMEIEGLPAQDVAELVGTNRNTVYSRLRRAREAFEAYVQRLDAAAAKGAR